MNEAPEGSSAAAANRRVHVVRSDTVPYTSDLKPRKVHSKEHPVLETAQTEVVEAEELSDVLADEIVDKVVERLSQRLMDQLVDEIVARLYKLLSCGEPK